MVNNNLKDRFISSVKKFELGLVYDITVENFSYDIELGEEYVECELTYQIDDRIERLDSEIVKLLTEEFNGEYDVSVSREDAYPNGYAYYKTSFSK